MKLFSIIQREFLTRVRTKGFVVFTLIIPLVMAGWIFAEIKIIQASRSVSTTIAVVDLSHQLYPALAQVLAAPPANPVPGTPLAGPSYTAHLIDATPDALPAVEAGLRRAVLDRQFDGYVIIPAGVLASRTADYHVRNAASPAIAGLQQRLGQAVNRARMEAAGLGAAQIDALTGNFDLRRLQLSAAGERTDRGQTANLAFALDIVIYVFLMMYGVVVMKSVTEEKTTRISEVLLSCVDPFSLMLGKILGVVSTALAQLVIWGACLALVSGYGVAVTEAAGSDLLRNVPHLSAGVFIAFILFFLLGFLVYASIYAAIGAMVSSDQEAQQTQVPLTLLLVFAIYLSFMVMANPSSPLSVVLSLIPFFAPMLMLMRIAVSNPPLWQVGLSMLLCLGTFLALTKVTAKIYRVGILMTGKRPNLPELLRWLRYA